MIRCQLSCIPRAVGPALLGRLSEAKRKGLGHDSEGRKRKSKYFARPARAFVAFQRDMATTPPCRATLRKLVVLIEVASRRKTSDIRRRKKSLANPSYYSSWPEQLLDVETFVFSSLLRPCCLGSWIQHDTIHQHTRTCSVFRSHSKYTPDWGMEFMPRFGF